MFQKLDFDFDKKNGGTLTNYLKIISLPLVLAVLFVMQNQIFNIWLGIYSKAYSVRLFFVAFALGIVFYGPALLFNRKYKYWYLFIISFIVSIIFVAQFLNYSYSQSFLQFSAIKYLDQAGSVWGTIKTLLSFKILLFLSNFLLVLIVFLISLGKKTTRFILPKWEKLIIILVMIVIVFFGYKYLLDTEKKEWGSTSRLYTDVYDLKSLVGKMGIMNFFLEDTFKYILRSNLVTDADKAFLKTWAENRNTTENSNKFFGLEKGKNVIIIQVESLENAVINKKVGGKQITPNLNLLVRDGLYFDNFYAQVGPGNTADAEFSTMNSLYPLANDVAFINYAKNDYNALPQLLADNGYKTYSMHGDVPTFWNRSNIYPELGYQESFDLKDYIITRPIGKGPSKLGDEDLFSQSLQKMKNMPQPFMANIITMSSHTPFILPDDLQELEIPAELNLNWIQEAYLQSIHYTDKAIGNFINGLIENGLYENSLILIWGDHGSFTNISSVLDKNSTTTSLDKNQIPMIVLGSKDLKGVINIPGSQLDIYPTIANLLGITPPKSILGQDLLNTPTPIETHFELVSGGIDAILTPTLSYTSNTNGIFDQGECKSLPKGKSLPILDCKDIYTQQTNNIKASNIIIRGNLLNLISK